MTNPKVLSRLLKKFNSGLFQAKKSYSIPQFASKLGDNRLFKVHYKTDHGFSRVCIAKSLSSFVVFQQPVRIAALTLSFLLFSFPLFSAERVFDLVIANGRVIDPESKTDEVRNIGVKDGKIAVLSKSALTGKTSIDAAGLIVSPGFIDFLSYDPNGIGEAYKVFDGVTTNLSMHGSSRLDFMKGTPCLVNYGGAINHMSLRLALGINGAWDKPTSEQIGKMEELCKKALKSGGMGLSFSLEYMPGTTYEESYRLMKLCAKQKALVTFHARYGGFDTTRNSLDGIKEITNLARLTGTSVQLNHINSTGGTFCMKEALAFLESERKAGVDIMANTYPYDSWATYLFSARFDGNWQKRFRIDYSGLQVAGTKERLTKEKFDEIRRSNPLTVAYAIPEEDNVLALKSPFVFIGSDTLITASGNNHPRGAGCFARLIGVYVREKKVLSLMDALAKVTIMPALRVEQMAPRMKNKGRLKVGADADITIFNFDKIRDTSTVEKPASYSDGIEYVIVNGTVVKDKKGMVKVKVLPGVFIRRE